MFENAIEDLETVLYEDEKWYLSPDGLVFISNLRFLREEQISEIAVEASARLFCTEEAQLEHVIDTMSGCLGN